MFEGAALLLFLMVLASGAAVSISFYQTIVTTRAVRRLSPEDQALFKQGWVKPEHIRLHELTKLEDLVYYPVLYEGRVELAYHSSGIWTHASNGQPLDGPFHIYHPRETDIPDPNIGSIIGRQF
jgi:hypothetical protein